MGATPEFPRASQAANNVDPMVLASALDHIARAAARSRSMTRRIRWIGLRAELALAGKEYRDTDVDLPKSARPGTPEKLQKRLAYEIAVHHGMRDRLEALMAKCREDHHELTYDDLLAVKGSS